MKFMKGAALVASLAWAFPAFAQADTIDFAQFGPIGTAYTSATGTTANGIGFTVTGPARGMEAGQQWESWAGTFRNGTSLLQTDYRGSMTFVFDSVIAGIDHIGIEAGAFGSYDALLQAFDSSGTLIGTASYTAVSAFAPGTQPYFTFVHVGIASIVLSVTHDDVGFAVGYVDRVGVDPTGVPEPGAWAMLIVGFAAGGAAVRARRINFSRRSTKQA